jgi:hypothetical protein
MGTGKDLRQVNNGSTRPFIDGWQFPQRLPIERETVDLSNSNARVAAQVWERGMNSYVELAVRLEYGPGIVLEGLGDSKNEPH